MVAVSLRTVAVYVRDRRNAAAWYREKLGATIVDQEPEHWTTVRLGRGAPLLHLCEKGDGRKLARADVGESGIGLTVPGNFVAACKRMKASGVKFAYGPKEMPWGWMATIIDLDGNELHLSPDAPG